MTSESQFYARFQEFFDRILADVPIFATYLGDHRFDDRLGRYDQATLERQLTDLKSYEQELDTLDVTAFNPDAAIDYTLARHAVRHFIRESVQLRQEYRDPGYYVSVAMNGVFLLIVREFAPLRDRLRSILGRLTDTPRIFAEGQANLIPEETPPLWARMGIESARRGVALYTHLIPALAPQAPELTEALLEAARQAAAAAEAYADWVEQEILRRAAGDFAAGQDLFNTMLRENHMVDWDADALLARGEELYARTLAQMESVARQIDPDKSASDLVEAIKAHHPTADQLLDVYRREMARARDFVIEQDLVTIPPDEELIIVETPMFARNQIPYAAYMAPGLLEKTQRGVFVVTPVDPAAQPEVQEEKLRGHGFDEIPITALHEAYPGHHLQLTVANRIKSLPRILGGMLTSLFIEGWAFYCEEMMQQQGFLDRPTQRLARLQAQLWRAARIIVDVSLHTGRMSYEDAVQFMIEKANLEPGDARVEVDRYTQSPTQPMSYLMGKMEILELVDEYRRRFPDHGLKQMHDAILSTGSLPPSLIRRRLFPNA